LQRTLQQESNFCLGIEHTNNFEKSHSRHEMFQAVTKVIVSVSLCQALEGHGLC